VIVALAASALVLAGCGDDDAGVDDAERYSPELRDQFVEACTVPGDSEAVCGCFYDALEANVPFERFQQVDEEIREGPGELPDDIVDLAVACGADPTFAATATTSTTSP
jgi:hypothetical protein